MPRQSAHPEFSSAPVQERHVGESKLLSDYWALTKPEVNFLILITTFVGFYLASATDGQFSFARIFNTLLGTLLVASSCGPNQRDHSREAPQPASRDRDIRMVDSLHTCVEYSAVWRGRNDVSVRSQVTKFRMVTGDFHPESSPSS
jgi:hypothetical protein